MQEVKVLHVRATTRLSLLVFVMPTYEPASFKVRVPRTTRSWVSRFCHGYSGN
jgi:hypothetical protein